jgi:branched-chain amino acid transport system permease protein
VSSISKYQQSKQAVGALAAESGVHRSMSIALALALSIGVFCVVTVGIRTNEAGALVVYALFVAAAASACAWITKSAPVLAAAVLKEAAILRAVAVVGAFAMPAIAGDPYQLHVLAGAAIFALMAIGLNVTIGYAGLADFGYIAYYAIGAYTSALLNVRLGVSFWLCLPAAGLVAALLSLIVAFPAVRVKGHYLALITLGFSFIVLQLITNLAWLTGGTEGVSGIDTPNLFGHDFGRPLTIGPLSLPREANYYYLVIIILALAAVAVSRLRLSRWGRLWAAMRLDETAAEAAGINLTWLKLVAFMTGSCLGGLAGSLYAHMIGFIDPSTFHGIDSIMLIAVVALGNWNVAGVIAAAAVFSVLPEMLRAFGDFRPLLFAVALLCVMLIRGRRMASAFGR